MRRALLSVTDKSGLTEFAKGLLQLGFEVISTGGTAKVLAETGIPVVNIEEVTGFPEMLDGRIKTLHPKVHGGLLGDLRKPMHVEAMARAGIDSIEILAVNLYAFEKTVTGPHSFEEAIESIDIGGPAMIRAAAKNHSNVWVVVDPKDYSCVLKALGSPNAQIDRSKLAAKAFAHTAYYDSLIARYLESKEAGGQSFPETITLGIRHDGLSLRYGENPHQRAARYIDPLNSRGALQPFKSTGKEISYNNWLDADAAWELVCDLPQRGCAIIKHGNPCGAAVGNDLGESYRQARASDPISAFGGIVAFNFPIDESAVEAMTEKGNFLEVVIAPSWKNESLIEEFSMRSKWAGNVRFLVGSLDQPRKDLVLRSIRGGFLVQDGDIEPEVSWKVVTMRQPSQVELSAMQFLWRIIPHVKSNAIVIGNQSRLLGVGAGQMNRVQSVRLALEQAGEGSKGAALASDAFFPFPDSVETAAKEGISAIIQPGGSKKDEEVIAAADELGLAMVFTGVRHFRH